MADQKLTQLTEDATPVGADLLYIVVDTGGTPAEKKATITNVVAAGQAAGVGARVYGSADLVIAHNTNTYVLLNSERYDTDTIHDTATNTSRLTCPIDGKYIIGFHGIFAANATGYRQVRIHLNRTTYIADEVKYPGGANQVRLNLVTVYDLVAGDYVEAHIYQSSGGNLTLFGTATTPNVSPEFWMHRIG